MKVIERVLEKRMQLHISIDVLQFCIMPGKGTIGAIFHMRKVRRGTKSEEEAVLYFLKLGMYAWIIRSLMALYTMDCTVVRTYTRSSESFKVNVGFHQRSVSSPLLFSVVMDIDVVSVRRKPIYPPSCCMPIT